MPKKGLPRKGHGILHLDQERTPLFDAVKKYVGCGVIPFHVPGHKQGRGIPELREYIGDHALQMDVNGMDDLDYINNPTGVILQSEELLAAAYGAKDAFFLVNGTTQGVQAMILSTCEPGARIILPRNAHKSTVGGIILSGATPVYVQPEINKDLGIAMGVQTQSIKNAIKENPHASAVFIINPTYYGAASDLKSIVHLAHMYGMYVLVDEAHGAHMPFHKDFPVSAMAAGADMSAVSLHKTGGSMTQSSVLLINNRFDGERVRQALNLTYTSSASYLLLCSIDAARKQLALHGCEMLEHALCLARKARKKINEIAGLYAFGKELVGTPGCFDFDETKLGVNVTGLGLTGYAAEKILRSDYNIQVEMSDLYNILALITIGDTEKSIDALVTALSDIAKKHSAGKTRNLMPVPENPEMIVTPREAFYSAKKTVKLEKSVGEISGEMVMAYPPGIPVISYGERISAEVVDYLKKLKAEKCELQGAADPNADYITILGK